jgi:hypothetical protein
MKYDVAFLEREEQWAIDSAVRAIKNEHAVKSCTFEKEDQYGDMAIKMKMKSGNTFSLDIKLESQ